MESSVGAGAGAAVGGPPGAGTELTRAWRLGWAAGLLVLALAAGGLTMALLNESGRAALIGRRAVAEVRGCTGVKIRTCDARVFGPDGTQIDSGAKVAGFTQLASGDVVHVRYRAGRAAPDTVPERALHLSFMLLFGGAAAVGLLGAGAMLAGRGARVALVAVLAPLAAIPLVAVSLVGSIVVGAPKVSAPGGPATAHPRVGGRAAPDIYAEVAATGRVLVAQGVRFDQISNRPYSVEGCFGAAGCIAGASADWRVSGTDLVATTHLLVFETPEQAKLVADAVERDGVLPNAPAPPSGAVVIGSAGGHYADVVWMSRADGSPVRDDPALRPSLRGLSYFNGDPALAEKLRPYTK